VKAIHRANLDAVGQFALDAALGNDKSHFSGPYTLRQTVAAKISGA
jgi:hypothetical protein